MNDIIQRNQLGQSFPLQWHHSERDGVSNPQPHDCLLKRIFRPSSKKSSNHRWPVNFPHKRTVTRKMLPFDDVTMPRILSSCLPGHCFKNVFYTFHVYLSTHQANLMTCLHPNAKFYVSFHPIILCHAYSLDKDLLAITSTHTLVANCSQ